MASAKSHKINIGVLALWAVLMSSLTFAQDDEHPIFNDDNLALLDVVYERQILGNGIDAYVLDEMVYIPLVDLVSVFELDITVDDNGAIGTLYPKNLPFELASNEENWYYRIGDTPSVALTDAELIVFDSLIFIEKELSKRLFGAELLLNFQDSRATLNLLSALPFSDRLKRQSRKIDSQYFIGPAVQSEWKQPYAWLAMPSADARINYLNTRYTSEEVRRQHTNSLYYSAKTVGDFMKMSTTTFISGVRDEGLTGASLRMDRYDNAGELLGPLKLSQISLGDISYPSVAGVGGNYGRGIFLANDTVGGNASRDIRDIEGDYHPGWEVELYLNGAIVGYQVIDESGWYRFKDVILFDGENKFLLRFYGPSGEEVEERRSIYLGDRKQAVNSFKYSLSISEPGAKLVDINDQSEKVDKEDDIQWVLSTRYRAHRNLGLSASYQETILQEDETLEAGQDTDESSLDSDSTRKFYALGAQAYLGGVSLNLQSSNEVDGPSSLTLGIGGSIRNTQYQFRYFDSDSGEHHQDAEQNARTVDYGYEMAINSRWRSHAFVTRGRVNHYGDGRFEEGRVGYSTQFGLFSFSTALEYENSIFSQSNSLDESVEDGAQVNGSAFVGLSMRPVFLRLSSAYVIEPESDLTNVALSSSWRIDSDTNFDASISRNIVSESTQYRMGLTWVNDFFRLAPMVVYSDTGYWQGQVQMSMSFGGRTGRMGNYYRAGSDPTLTQGVVRARLFDDLNRDGTYQIGETLLSGGELKALQARRQGRSNKAGVTWIESMPPWRTTDVLIDENSIDSGYVALAREPFSVTPRPGKVIDLDVPFVKVGEVDGTVFINDEDILTEARGVTVLLLDADGSVVADHRTDSLGYFTFARLKPGVYTLDVMNEDVQKVDPDKVYIGSMGEYVSDIHIHIEPKKQQSILEKAFGDEVEQSNDTEPVMDIEVPAPTKQENSEPIFNGINLEPVDEQVILSVPIEPAVDVPTLWPAQPSDSVAQSSSTEMDKEKPWSLQLASFSVESSANDLYEKLEFQGYAPEIMNVTVKGRNYYRVIVTGFESRVDALREKPQVDMAFGVSSLALDLTK